MTETLQVEKPEFPPIPPKPALKLAAILGRDSRGAEAGRSRAAGLWLPASTDSTRGSSQKQP